MKTMIFTQYKKIRYLALLLAAAVTPTEAAETITIGKGTGVLWEGMPFNFTVSAPLTDTELLPRYGLLSISTIHDRCLEDGRLTTIGGVQALRIAPGVGLVPRANGTAQYTLADGTVETLSGTIGLPSTEGTTSSGVTITNPAGGRLWCLPPRMDMDLDFYDKDADRTATLSGTWVLVADGSQVNSEITIPQMWAASFSAHQNGDVTKSILPAAITLRISTLACGVTTPTTINFGSVSRSTLPDAELSSISHPFNVSCTQNSDPINANINVQFRAISGLYNSAPNQLSLKQGGGYITGTIDGVTSDGYCGSRSGITFDNTQIKIGEIKDSENNKAFNNQIVWRLCSGGSDLPTGKVDASAELLVTYN
jgi:type 1 fimbria pilin